MCVGANNHHLDDTADSTPPSSTPSLTYAAPGSHAVGTRVFTTTGAQEQPLTVRAWYPAVRTTAEPGPISYTAPNKFGEQITPGAQITSVGRALADAQPEQTDEPYPLVVFSHGYSLSPIVYSTLVEHYASQGYVVLAPEHNESFDGSLTEFWQELIDRPVDIHRTIDFAEQLTEPGAPLAGLIDVDSVAVVGHSYGGYTALAAAGARFDFAAYTTRCAALTADDPLNFFCAPIPNESDMAMRAGLDEVPSGLWPSFGDPRIKAAISLAGDAYLFDQRGLAELEVPIMAMGGTVDDGTPYTWGAKLTYDHAASENKTLVSFPGAGHFLFLDPCENLPWVENSVYRDAICTDAVWDTRPFDIVAHYTTAFLRDTLDADPEARATLSGPQPLARQRRVRHDESTGFMKPRRVIVLVLASIIAMIGFGLLAAGASLGWAYGTQRDDAGFFTTSTERFETDSFALTSDKIDLGQPGPDDWWADRDLATVRITVDNADARPVFVGIGPESDVETYLAGIPHDDITDVDFDRFSVDYRRENAGGTSTPAPPADQAFWVAQASGEASQSLTWDLEPGNWAIVVMNADATDQRRGRHRTRRSG